MFVTTLLKKLFHILYAYCWFSLAGITVIVLLYTAKKVYIYDEDTKLKAEAKKSNIWSSRSLLFQSFAELALEHLVTTRPPEYTLPFAYIAEKLKEIREEGVLRLGGDDDPLVAHRRLMLTLKQWRMTRQAWKHLPGLTGYIYNPHQRVNQSSLPPVPFRNHQDVLNDIGEYNEDHTEPLPVDHEEKSSETKLSDETLVKKLEEKLYDELQETVYDGKNYHESKDNISSYEKISAYSSKSTEVIEITDEFQFLDTFEYMDILYRNLSKASPIKDLKFQLLQKALKFTSENAKSRQLVLDKQNMDLLIKYLKQKPEYDYIKNKTDDIDPQRAFHMLKQNLNTTRINLLGHNHKVFNSNFTENITFMAKNDKLQSKYYDHLKTANKSMFGKNESQENDKKYSKHYVVSSKRPIYNHQIKEKEKILKNKNYTLILDNEKYYKKLTSSSNTHYYEENIYNSSNVKYTKGIFTRRPGITIRPYTRKKYTIRLHRTYASVRSLKAYRTYTARFMTRKKSRWFSQKTGKIKSVSMFDSYKNKIVFHKILKHFNFTKINKKYKDKNVKLHTKKFKKVYTFCTQKHKILPDFDKKWYNHVKEIKNKKKVKQEHFKFITQRYKSKERQYKDVKHLNKIFITSRINSNIKLKNKGKRYFSVVKYHSIKNIKNKNENYKQHTEKINQQKSKISKLMSDVKHGKQTHLLKRIYYNKGNKLINGKVYKRKTKNKNNFNGKLNLKPRSIKNYDKHLTGIILGNKKKLPTKRKRKKIII